MLLKYLPHQIFQNRRRGPVRSARHIRQVQLSRLHERGVRRRCAPQQDARLLRGGQNQAAQ